MTFDNIFRKVSRQSKILSEIEKSGTPKFIKGVIFKIYGFNANRNLLKSTKVILPKLEKDINELKAVIENEDFKRNRFPKLFNNKLFFTISLMDLMVTHR